MRTIHVDSDDAARSTGHPLIRDEACTYRLPREKQHLCPSKSDHLTNISGWGRASGGGVAPTQKLEIHVINGAEERANEYCTICGYRSSPLPRRAWEALIRLGTEVGYRFIHSAHPCSVTGCTNTGHERHHWAPVAVFGATADAWPTSLLCREHHQEWHRAMTGYEWTRRRVA